MKHLDLFSGIGGFAVATEMMWENVEHIFCDNDSFSQEILKKHWPNSQIHGDIRQLTTDTYCDRRAGCTKINATDGRKQTQRESPRCCEHAIDILTGGFPCQPFSQAGRRKGTEDDRHLWPEMLRVIRESHPLYIVGENVGGLLTWDGGMVFEQVCLDLEGEGYEVGAFVIPAAAVNAPHRRDRVWIVGHSKYDGQHGTENTESDTKGNDSDTGRENELCQSERTDSLRETLTNARCERWKSRSNENIQPKREKSVPAYDSFPNWSRNWYEVATTFCRMDDGIPRRLDRNPRLKALGNAIVPQVAAEIMRALSPSSSLPKSI
jgi:DNA (cytosine-5)-methyltransferase 1